MSVNRLYDTWCDWIKQLRPAERITQLRNMAWLITGIVESSSVHLSKIARKMKGQVQLSSQIQRLSRFVDNGRVSLQFSAQRRVLFSSTF